MWPEPAAAAGSMSAGPPLQLAVLWPWLLMATLHARLGHTGLALAAAVETERSAAQKAIIRVIPLKVEPIVLEGEFANVAEVTPAEGKLLQSHPLSLCNTSEDEHTESGFITIVKLEQPDRDPNPCLSLANKAKLAGERGARAILFDITDDESAADQLRKPRGLSQPVVLIRGHDAELLMGVVNKNREAHVKIEVKEPPAWVRDTPFPLPSVSFLPSCCAMEQDFPRDAELWSPGTEITALCSSCLSTAFR